ncbi:hypothetical protein [Labilibaculum antarcticum]|uniref:Uncharacterized protein n=1 Tax=Labilibaculum antarcticum TaxID=1717717 RepID=A0A1Y1CQD0_9BACT|nr:hypothetical protein [Labilibaculum antarcticum]BAX82464.1 hypothetical protein ALGA_4173 [Labilibaculum antarcticum]
MSKKRKKKTPALKYNERAAINVNFNRIKQVCEILGCADALRILTQQEIEEVYQLRMHFMQPKMMAGHKISREKMKIYSHFSQLFCKQEKSVLVEGQKPVSVITMVAVERFIAWHSYVPETRSIEIRTALHVLFGHFAKIEKPITDLYWNYNRILALSNPFTTTMHTFKTSYEYRKDDVHGLYHTLRIFSVEPRVSKVKINGIKRIAYQIGCQSVNDEPHWISISAAKLSSLYKGDEAELPVFIQNHALIRYLSRIKPIKKDAGQSYIGISIRNKEPIIYRRNVLFPICYKDFKVGYFIARIVGDKLVISTFLFVTQRGTPEGDKLEKLSGLSKEEITYWNIAKLDVFASSEMNPEQGIFTLFKECGLDYLFDAAKHIGENENYSYNWDAFNEYMRKGKELLNDDLEGDAEEADLQEEDAWL